MCLSRITKINQKIGVGWKVFTIKKHGDSIRLVGYSKQNYHFSMKKLNKLRDGAISASSVYGAGFHIFLNEAIAKLRINPNYRYTHTYHKIKVVLQVVFYDAHTLGYYDEDNDSVVAKSFQILPLQSFIWGKKTYTT